MLRNLLLALLTLCLAAPAVAMPITHASPVSTAAMPGHEGHQGDHGQAPADQAAHQCIGCIAPISVLPTAVAPLFIRPSLLLPQRAKPLATNRGPPETPPPRI